MKRLRLLLLLWLLPSVAICQDTSQKINLITWDSLQKYPNYLDEEWKFKNGDDSAWSSPSLDDEDWSTARSRLFFSDSSKPEFSGIGWFRYHFVVDSTVAGRPLGMTITHYGASQIFLDGKLIQSFGEIKDADSTRTKDPQELPFVLIIPHPGKHVLAVRYANYQAEKNYKKFGLPMQGFKMMLGDPDRQIFMKNLRSTIFSFIVMLLSGIFLALSLIHLFMFFYHRDILSNLYFSIFMFSLAAILVIGFTNYASTTPSFELMVFYWLVPACCLAGVSLSGFINELFRKKRFRFLVIAGIAIAVLIFHFFRLKGTAAMLSILIISVAFDTVFTVLFAILKKVKGARIIGTGVLFFALFFLFIYTLAYIKGQFDLNDSTTGGRIMIILLGLAIISIPVSMSAYQAWNFARIHADLSLQLNQVNLLSKEKQHILESKKEELEHEVQQRTAELQLEKKKSDDLLLNILPSEIAEEIKQQGRSQAKAYSMVTVMFTDFVEFTEVSEKVSAELLVAEIDHCFSAFDNIVQKYHIEKIKTVGDAYLCVGGMPVLTFNHAADTVEAAIEIRNFMLQRRKEKDAKGETPFVIRIGIHTGPVVAGIVGIKKFAYDIWGDTVNLAARMEQHGEAGKINISGTTYQLVKDKFNCTHRGKIEVKNKGVIDMYFVERNT